MGYRWYDSQVRRGERLTSLQTLMHCTRMDNVPEQGTNPLFPFGHGLSYTAFDYSPAHVTPASSGNVSTWTVALNVTNSGQISGAEVVQVRSLVS